MGLGRHWVSVSIDASEVVEVAEVAETVLIQFQSLIPYSFIFNLGFIVGFMVGSISSRELCLEYKLSFYW